jgi:F-type H+-transporting ATPase subunit gamma
MKTVGRLRKTIQMAEDLSSIVGTMKTLAAVNMRQFERSASAIGDYVRTIEMGFSVLLKREPRFLEHATRQSEVGRTGRVVIGTDQGLCGGFNERVASHARRRIAEDPGPVITIGHRVARRLSAGGVEFEVEYRTPGSVSGITPLVSDLLIRLGKWQAPGGVDSIMVLHNAPETAATFSTVRLPLLPLDRPWLEELRDRQWRSRSMPIFRAPPDDLFSWLVQEWLFARVYQAIAESLAAENVARLMATQSASRSIDERLADLRGRYRTERQRAITEELLDLHR